LLDRGRIGKSERGKIGEGENGRRGESERGRNERPIIKVVNPGLV
jgi:hypothetical protein